MPIDKGTETLAVTTQERTWRINIEAPYKGTIEIQIYRELIKFDANSKVVSRELVTNVGGASIVRRLAAPVSGQSVTIGGKTVTFQQLAQVIEAFADMWRAEDIANPPANPAPFIPPAPPAT